MKNILLITPELEYTGALKATLYTCNALLDLGNSVKIITYRWGPFVREFDSIGVSIQHINEYDINKDFVKFHAIGYDLAICSTILTHKFYKYAKDIMPTLWHIHEGGIMMHTFMNNESREALKKAKHILTVSEYTIPYIKELSNSKINIDILHNCIKDEFDKYIGIKRKNNDKIKFLALGTIEYRKGYDILIDSFLGLKDINVDYELHFAGRKYDFRNNFTPNLFDKIKDHKDIIYHGDIKDHNKIYDLIADSDVVIVPSRDESCSLVALEAAMLAKPIILTKNVGAQYICDSSCGWIIDANSVEALQEAIKDAISKKDQLANMGKNARSNYLKTSTYKIFKDNISNILSKISVNPLLYKIKSKNYELISFDIFDTLITRKVATPDGIFYLIQNELISNKIYENLPILLRENFAHIRKEVEQFLYVRYCNGKDIQDITIDQIYTVIAHDFNLNLEDKNKLISLEISTEFDNIIPINSNINILKEVIKLGQRVILVSNMYLDSKTIRKFLLKFDQIFYDIDIYVSCEYKFSKSNGELYRIVLQKENIDPNEYLHYGDNYNFDCQQAAKFEIDTIAYGYPKLKYLEQSLLDIENIANSKDYCDIQYTIGASRNLRIDNGNDLMYELGVSLGGYILLPYVDYIIKHSLSKSIKHLYFVARDGFILKEIADLIIKKYNYKITTNYIYFSRVVFDGKFNKSLIAKYISQEIKNNNNFAFVEWSGTGKTMNYVLNIINKYNISSSCMGVYYVLHALQKYPSNVVHDKMYSMTRNLKIEPVFELLCRSLENQVIGYKEKKGIIYPILSSSNEHMDIKKLRYDRYIQGVKDFAGLMLENNVKLDSMKLFKHCIESVVNNNIDLDFINALGEIPFLIDGDSIKTHKFAPRLHYGNEITNNMTWSQIRSAGFEYLQNPPENNQAEYIEPNNTPVVPDEQIAHINFNSNMPTGAADRIKNQLSYKIGFAIVHSKSLTKIISLPFRLFYIVSEYKKEKQITKVLKEKGLIHIVPIEQYADYDQAIKTKKHLSYRVGSAILKIFKMNSKNNMYIH